jgi:hypothetical protein
MAVVKVKKRKVEDEAMDMLLVGLQKGLEDRGVKGTKILRVNNGKEEDITNNQELRTKYSELENRSKVKVKLKKKK